MIMDIDNEFSDNQTVTVSAPSTHSIDLKAEGDAEKELYLEILVDEAVEAGGAATVNFALQTATDEAFTSPVTLWASGVIAKATLVAGYVVAKLRIPKGVLQYLRLYHTVATGPLTAGKFSGWLTPDIDHGNA